MVERSKGTLCLEAILKRARDRFLGQETYDPTLPSHPLHGKMKEGYTFYMAARDAVGDLREPPADIDMVTLAARMMRETIAKPDDGIDWGGIDGIKSWDEVAEFIVANIIHRELPKKYPELIAENERRRALDEG